MSREDGGFGFSGDGSWTRRVGFFSIGLLASLVCLLVSSSSALATLKSVPGSTPSTNGVVYTVLQVGDTVYLGGDFQRVDGTTRYNLAAIDANTGELKPWNPRIDCCVRALAASSDGTRVYAGGSFTSAGGESHPRLAAIDAASGQVSDTWNPAASSTVNALAVQGDSVYLGGEFRAIDGVDRRGLAMVSGPDGDLDQSWHPAANGVVRKLKTFGPRLYIGGTFKSVGGKKRRNLATVLTDSGATTSWHPNPARPVLDLAVSGKRVYTAEGGRGGAVSAYRTGGEGRRAWSTGADGDAQAVALMDERLYVGGHFDVLAGKPRYRAAALFPGSGKLDKRWAPRFNSGIWAMTPDAARGQLYAGGSFSSVSGRPQSGLARFSRS